MTKITKSQAIHMLDVTIEDVLLYLSKNFDVVDHESHDGRVSQGPNEAMTLHRDLKEAWNDVRRFRR